MKVLMLADGRSIHTIRFQSEMIRQGADVVLASLEPGETVDILLKHRTGVGSLDYFLSGTEIGELSRRISPDIINPHFASGYGFAVSRSGAAREKPVMLHCLGSDILISPRKSRLHRMRVQRALKAAGKIVVDSSHLAGEVRHFHPGAKIEIIPWGVEPKFTEVFEKREQRIKGETGPIKVLVPRPHNRIYNNCFIIEALRDEIIDRRIALTFPGRGDDYDSFRHYAKRIFHSDIISYYDYLPHEKYAEFLAGFDVYLSAALSDSSPVSLLEAMAAGLFPVVANIPGVRDWINDANALLFEAGKADSLRKCFSSIIEGKIDRPTILKANHEKIREKAFFPSNIKSTMVVMERMMTGG